MLLTTLIHSYLIPVTASEKACSRDLSAESRNTGFIKIKRN